VGIRGAALKLFSRRFGHDEERAATGMVRSSRTAGISVVAEMPHVTFTNALLPLVFS